jgi:hypothetical protein
MTRSWHYYRHDIGIDLEQEADVMTLSTRLFFTKFCTAHRSVLMQFAQALLQI